MDATNAFYSIGWNGLFSIFVTLGLIAVSWFLLREVRWEQWFRHPQSPRARVLQLIVAVIVGHLLARFVLDYWSWTESLKWLFRS
ncbi:MULTISPECIES: DUF1146 family protein [Cohnella]|jgi:uncharacterized integral membrane protein (TIGR02327 family)|uniref:DUF1146 family protein n=1 Tax=Cohnella TaxID=329857 RepID=UPI00036D9125|nr:MULTISPECIES: DUF1146 domain-containing protein [Cohnella]REK66526.1 MAG: DUF1146 domain-containing protein [Cohnella sp.]